MTGSRASYICFNRVRDFLQKPLLDTAGLSDFKFCFLFQVFVFAKHLKQASLSLPLSRLLRFDMQYMKAKNFSTF